MELRLGLLLNLRDDIESSQLMVEIEGETKYSTSETIIIVIIDEKLNCIQCLTH